MAETTFDIVYDGPALDLGVMPVRELAPALLELAEVFTTASVIKYPKRDPVALNIKATEDGSFLVQLIATTTALFDSAVDIFSSNAMQALEGLVFSVVGARKSLFWLITNVGRRQVVAEDADPMEPGCVKLTLDDGVTIEGVPTDVAEFYKNLNLRRHAQGVVDPLSRDGVDAVCFKVNDKPEARVEKDDLPSFDVPDADEKVENDVVQDMVLDIVSPVFEEGTKWSFFDGERKFSATIEDEKFVSQVNAGEAFSKGDALHCSVRVIQTRGEDNRLRVERRIVAVRAHQRRTENQLTIREGDSEPS